MRPSSYFFASLFALSVAADNPFLQARQECAAVPTTSVGLDPSPDSEPPVEPAEPTTTTSEPYPTTTLESRTEMRPDGQVITTTLTLTLPGPVPPVGSAVAPPPETADPSTHVVDVFANSGSSFRPSQVNAVIGDVVRFNFEQRNQTITQSSLDMPCIASGQASSTANEFSPLNVTGALSVDFRVEQISPLWFYSRSTNAGRHCSAETVFAINPGDAFGTFTQNADLQGHLRARRQAATRRGDKPYLGRSSGILSVVDAWLWVS
ncbi:putative GPI-anchored cupredoxin [Colletotrichum sp. SAR11_240]|nr:putative GPI-anchored cupredoxin [Colletotrichum sp. SAR11_240]